MLLISSVTSQTLSIQSLLLLNTVTKVNLGPIVNGTTIQLSNVGNQLTVQANVIIAPSTTSVIFDMDGKQQVRIEDTAPYTLAGDMNGTLYFASVTLVQPGVHTISATAYSRNQGLGLAGKKYTVQFTTVVATVPVRSPTKIPTVARPPTKKPTRKPTKAPISVSIRSPTMKLTRVPTKRPTRQPTMIPRRSPVVVVSPVSPIRTPISTGSHCGCVSCTESTWNRQAGEYTCGSRITWLMSTLKMNENDACMQIANEFPNICGMECHPEKCGLIQPAQITPTLPVRVPVAFPMTSVPIVSNKCGGAVNTGESSIAICTMDLWNPTGDTTQHCYAYGGPSDPCSLHNNNDVNDGLFKNPSACTGNTFYLWDEPDTQGKDYTWAGMEWAKYATRFTNEIQTLRRRGVQFTSPLLRAGSNGVIAAHLNTFFSACGPVCHDPNHPAYININAINAFVGSWNAPGIVGCRDAAIFIANEVKGFNNNNSAGRRPWYVTNWSRLGTMNIQDQVDAMNVIGSFFGPDSPIQRIYWFGATDYGGNSGNNFLTSKITINGASTTLGQIWESNCNALS